MISSLSDVYAAYDAGRSHTQRFVKTGAGQVADGKWQDWAFQAGQPGYDARIGRVAALTPVVAQGNDAIYLPPIATGQQRLLHRLTLRPQASGASQASINFVLYDLARYFAHGRGLDAVYRIEPTESGARGLVGSGGAVC